MDPVKKSKKNEECTPARIEAALKKNVERPLRKGEVNPMNEFCPTATCDDPIEEPVVLEPVVHQPYEPTPDNNDEQDYFDDLPALPKKLPPGPISQLSYHRAYMERYNLSTIFDALTAGLMLHTPVDPLAYLEDKLNMISKLGMKNVTFETFIIENHPLVDPIRRKVVHEVQQPDQYWKLWHEKDDRDSVLEDETCLSECMDDDEHIAMNQERDQHAFREAAEVSGMMAESVSHDSDSTMFDFPSADYIPQIPSPVSSSCSTAASQSFYAPTSTASTKSTIDSSHGSHD